MYQSHLIRLTGMALAIVLLASSLIAAVPSTYAQSDIITITFAIPDFWAEMWGNELIDQFEAQNPTIRVKLVPDETGFYWYHGSSDINDFLTTFTDYASAADVLYVNSYSMSVMGTHAGIFLDLAPLTRTDADLNVDDFYQPAWESFQWDGGVWALPLGVDAAVLIYRPQAFDDAGLAYPSPNWTITELSNAIRTLTQFNSDGQVERPGIDPDSGNLTSLFRSLLGHGLYDASVTPNTPLLGGADAEAILEEWMQLERDGYLAAPVSEVDPADIPIRIEQTAFSLGSFGVEDTSDAEVVATLLPGGKAGLYIEGVALSSGTQHPDAAYAFIKFLSKSPQAANSFFSARPARQTLNRDMTNTEDNEDTSYFIAQFSPEDAALLDEALANAIPTSEMRYIEYLPGIVERMLTDNLSAADAINEMEAKAMADYRAALEWRNTPIMVAAAPPAVELMPGEIELNFGLGYMSRPLPNQTQWDQVIESFIASDPVVGKITLGSEIFDPSLDNMTEKFDCFFLPFNAIPGAKLELLLNLDPFMDADVNFNQDDLYPNVLSQLQQDGRVWAFPLVIQPKVLRYNRDLFEQAGVPLPENGWTSSEFADALSALYYTQSDAAFTPQGLGGSTYYMLIAAFGGLPFDYSTNPVTANFTDPDTVSAIRQVLDLARSGLIKYQPLSLLDNQNVVVAEEDGTAILETDLSPVFYRPPTPEENSPYRVVTYPTGTWYAPVAYDIGTAYISATAQNPEACYAWINQMAQRPDLLIGMPAQRSMITDPGITSTITPDMLNLYYQLDQMLTRPDAVTIPASLLLTDMTTLLLRFLSENWLNVAFDNYVLNNADLETELTQAEQYVNEFQACVANISPRDPAMDDDTYFTQFLDCAIAVDPSLAALNNE